MLIQVCSTVVLKLLPLVGTEPECGPHSIAHTLTWGISHASTSQASLPHSDGSLEKLLTYGDLPKFPRFPPLAYGPIWGLPQLRVLTLLVHPCHEAAGSIPGPHSVG